MGKKKETRGVASQAVRDYLGKNPDATAKVVVPALAEQGITVSNTLVNSIRSELNKKSGKGAKPGPKKRSYARSSQSGKLTAEELMETKRLVDKLGGFDVAKKALDSLEKLQ